MKIIFKNILFFVSTIIAINTSSLIYASSENNTGQPNSFLLADYYYDNKTDQKIPFTDAYQLYTESGLLTQKSSKLNGLLGVTGMVAFAATGYYTSFRMNNQPDWDLRWDLESWEKKLITFEAVTFDNNSLSLNDIGHSLAGTSYYFYCRSMKLNMFYSYLFSNYGSVMWEYFGECFEKPSINDMILTPLVGMAVGENFYQFANYILLNVNGNNNKYEIPIYIPHNFEIYIGLNTIETTEKKEVNSTTNIHLGLSTEIVNIPGYNAEGYFKHFIFSGNFTRFGLSTGLGENGVPNISYHAYTSFLGFYIQNIKNTGNDKKYLHGYSLFTGLAVGYDSSKTSTNHNIDDIRLLANYENYKEEYFFDSIHIVNLFGPMIDFSYFSIIGKIRCRLEFYPDFAMISSLVIDRFKNDYPIARIKSVLQKEDYYFAWGYTTSAEFSFEHRSLTLSYKLKYDYLNSIEGHDRYQERVTDDFNLVDQRVIGNPEISYNFPIKYLKASFGAENRLRSSEIRKYDLTRNLINVKVYGNIIYKF